MIALPRSVLAVVLGLALAAPYAAAAPRAVSARELVVALQADAKTRETLDAEDEWEDVCKAFAKGFVAGTGPWRLGPFAKATCRASVPKTVAPDAWLLTIAQKGASVTLTMSYDKADVAAVAFEGGEHTFGYLTDEAYAKLLALALLDQMPMIGRLANARAEDDGDRGADAGLPPPPDRLLVYRLTRDADAGLWRPRSLGTAKKAANDDPKAMPRWRARGKTAGDAFVHAEGGVGSFAEATAKRLEERHEKLASRFSGVAGRVLQLGDALASGAAAGYLGVRYGHSFFQGPVIRKMSFVGLLLELRGAPLDGLRVYFDLWPKAEDPVPSGATSFDASRLVLGWSFGGALGPFDRIDLVPKVGRWSVATSFAVPVNDAQTETVEFRLSNALSVGLEGGLEMRFGRVLTRGWVARDFDVDAFGKAQDTSVVDTRMGLDALIRGPWFSLFGLPTNLSFLAFTFYENVQLTRDAAAAAGQVSIDAVKYDVGYVGGGLALSY